MKKATKTPKEELRFSGENLSPIPIYGRNGTGMGLGLIF
jgi:hypothetical protein